MKQYNTPSTCPSPNFNYYQFMAKFASSLPVTPPLYMPVDWGTRSPGEKSSPVQDSRAQRARPEPRQVHDLVKAKESWNTRLQKENLVRSQGPTSHFVKAIKE